MDPVDEESEDEVVENVTLCPRCGENRGHTVLRERARGSGVDFLLKCEQCANVHTLEFRTPPPRTIPFMLTDGPSSRIVHIELDSDDILTEGEVFIHDDAEWCITRIEDLDNKPRRKRGVDRITRVVALRSDLVRVKLTLTRGDDSEAVVIEVPGDRRFSAGTMMEYQGEQWNIRAIHSGSGRTLSGSMLAREVKRIYLHEPVVEGDFQPRTEQERRRAWQEGRLGHNPNPVRPSFDKSGDRGRWKRQ